MILKKLSILAAFIAGIGTAQAGLVNSSFEMPDLDAIPDTTGFAGFEQLPEAMVPGWQTTASDGLIEIWANGFLGVTSFDGSQHAELNATEPSSLFQEISDITAGSIVGYEFAHRGRAGRDTMELTITDLGANGLFDDGLGDDTVLFMDQFSTDNAAWVVYNGTGIVALGNDVRFAYAAISTASASNSVGNFIDIADFGVGVGEVPVPAAVWLFGSGLLGLIGMRRKSQK